MKFLLFKQQLGFSLLEGHDFSIYDILSLYSSVYNPSNPTVYLIHGWTSTVSKQLEIKDAFLQVIWKMLHVLIPDFT